MMPILAPAGVQELIRLRPLWLCAEPLFRLLGRPQMPERHDRIDRLGRCARSIASSRSCRRISFCRPAASTSARTIPCSRRRRGCRRRSSPPMLALLRANRSTRSSSPAVARRNSASSAPANPISTCARRSMSLGIDEVRANALGPASLQDRLPLAARAEGPARIRARPRQDHRRRRKALADRGPVARRALWQRAISRSASARKTRTGSWLFPVTGALDPNDIAIAIGRRLLDYHPDAALAKPRRASRRIRSSASRR